MSIPNRMVQETVDDYITRNLKLFEEAGGTIIRAAGAPPTKIIDGVRWRTAANMDYSTKTIRLYEGHEIQDVVEELAHFRQSVRDGYWGTDIKMTKQVRNMWERQIDTLFKSLGFNPR